MPAKIVEVPELGTVHLYRKRGSRTIRLSFMTGGDIRVSLPLWAPYRSAIDFVISRREWIEQHRPSSKGNLETNDRIGKAHTMIFRPTVKLQVAQTRVSNNQVIVRVPYKSLESDSNVQEVARRGARRALRTEAEALLPQRLRTLATAHDFEYRSVNVKQLKSRWGSCSSERDIVLNFYLMQLPWHLIDYVLLHELTHTIHLHHGPEFWAHMESVLPGAKRLKNELKPFQTDVTPA